MVFLWVRINDSWFIIFNFTIKKFPINKSLQFVLWFFFLFHILIFYLKTKEQLFFHKIFTVQVLDRKPVFYCFAVTLFVWWFVYHSHSCLFNRIMSECMTWGTGKANESVFLFCYICFVLSFLCFFNDADTFFQLVMMQFVLLRTF